MNFISLQDLMVITLEMFKEHPKMESYVSKATQLQDIITSSKIANLPIYSHKDYVDKTPEILKILSQEINSNQFSQLMQYKSFIDMGVRKIFGKITKKS